MLSMEKHKEIGKLCNFTAGNFAHILSRNIIMTFQHNNLSLCYQEEIMSKFYLFQRRDHCEWYQL